MSKAQKITQINQGVKRNTEKTLKKDHLYLDKLIKGVIIVYRMTNTQNTKGSKTMTQKEKTTIDNLEDAFLFLNNKELKGLVSSNFTDWKVKQASKNILEARG